MVTLLIVRLRSARSQESLMDVNTVCCAAGRNRLKSWPLQAASSQNRTHRLKCSRIWERSLSAIPTSGFTLGSSRKCPKFYFVICHDELFPLSPYVSIFFIIPRQAEVALGIPARLRPRTLRLSALQGWKDVSQKHRPPLLQEKSFSEPESTSGHMVLSEGTTEKIPSDTIGDRSRDRPTSSAAP